MVEDDPTDLIGQELAQEDQQRKAELIRARELNDLKTVMATVQGRRWVWRLLAKCGVYRVSGSNDLAELARCEGKRLIGLDVLNAVLEACPEQQLRMMQEQLTHDATVEQ